MTGTKERVQPSKYETRRYFSGSLHEAGISGPPLRNIGLEYAPADFFQITDGSDHIYVTVINRPLSGEGLNNLFASVAPNRPRATNRYATITDLRMPDRARGYEGKLLGPHDQKVADNLQRLHRIHSESKVIRSAYTEFDQNNRAAILQALRDSPIEIDQLYHTAWHTRFIDRETFGSIYFQEILADFEGIYTDDKEYAFSAFGVQILSKNQDIAYLFNQFFAERQSRQPEMNSVEAFITSDDPIIVQVLNAFAIEHAQKSDFTLVDPKTKTIYPRSLYIPDQEDGGDEVSPSELQTHFLPNGEITHTSTVGAQEIAILMALAGEVNQPNNAGFSEVNIPSELFPFALVPVIAYRLRHTSDGREPKREFLTQPEVLDLIQDTTILPRNIHPDTSLGRIVMAYGSPQVVDSMARHMRLHPGQNQKLQPLNEAQTPVLYAVYADTLLSSNNRVLQAIEAIR